MDRSGLKEKTAFLARNPGVDPFWNDKTIHSSLLVYSCKSTRYHPRFSPVFRSSCALSKAVFAFLSPERSMAMGGAARNFEKPISIPFPFHGEKKSRVRLSSRGAGEGDGHLGLRESRRRGWKHVRKSEILTSLPFASIVLLFLSWSSSFFSLFPDRYNNFKLLTFGDVNPWYHVESSITINHCTQKFMYL